MRSQLVLARRIQGRTMEEIQAEFHVSRATAYRALSFARRHEFYEEARDTLMALVPKALSVYDAALDAGDADVASRILQAAGLEGKHVHIHAPTAEEGQVLTFEQIRTKIHATTVPASHPASPQDGDIVEALPALPGGAEAGEAGGGEDPGRDGVH